MKSILLLCIAALLILSCCRERDCVKYYSIDFPLNISIDDSIRLGDTLYYSMRVPNQMTDALTGELVDFTNFDIHFRTEFSRIDTNISNTALGDFDFFVDSGAIVQTPPFQNQILGIRTHSTNEKVFKIGLIPKKRGIFRSYAYLGDSLIIEEFYDSRECVFYNPGLEITPGLDCKETFATDTKFVYNNDSVNFHLIDGMCQTSSYNNSYYCYDRYDNNGFAFVVY